MAPTEPQRPNHAQMRLIVKYRCEPCSSAKFGLENSSDTWVICIQFCSPSGQLLADTWMPYPTT